MNDEKWAVSQADRAKREPMEIEDRPRLRRIRERLAMRTAPAAMLRDIPEFATLPPVPAATGPSRPSLRVVSPDPDAHETAIMREAVTIIREPAANLREAIRQVSALRVNDDARRDLKQIEFLLALWD